MNTNQKLKMLSSKSYIWIKQKGRFQDGENLMSGKVAVGVASFNGLRGKGESEDKSHNWRLLLPGKDRSGFTRTLDSAKKACQEAFEEWKTAAGLK